MEIEFIYEEWKRALYRGVEYDLEVSTFGRVKNSDGIILKTFLDRDDYEVLPSLKKYGLDLPVRVHRLVMETFIDNPENKPQVNHLDGKPYNNFLYNLEWATAEENIRHAIEMGLRAEPRVGEASNWNKYKESVIVHACELLSKGVSRKEVSKTTGIDLGYLTDLVSKKKWKHVTEKYTFPSQREIKFKGFHPDIKEEILVKLRLGMKPKEICQSLNIEYMKIHKDAITNLRKKL